MATDNIVYPVRYEMLRSSRGGELALIGANGESLMTCDSTSDFEMQHVVTRLNLAAKAVAKLKHYGFVETAVDVVQMNGAGRFDAGSRRFANWDEAVEACIDVALED